MSACRKDGAYDTGQSGRRGFDSRLILGCWRVESVDQLFRRIVKFNAVLHKSAVRETAVRWRLSTRQSRFFLFHGKPGKVIKFFARMQHIANGQQRDARLATKESSDRPGKLRHTCSEFLWFLLVAAWRLITADFSCLSGKASQR